MRNADRNKTDIIFILLGFSDYPELQIPLFLVFLVIYIITVTGNLGMIVIIRINPKLHTPMYFFLSHLSFIDFCYSTAITPKLLQILVVEDRTISFTPCIMQYSFAVICVVTEAFLLAVMAYDRFVAICNPLLYIVVMSQKRCALLMTAVYTWGIISSSVFIYSLLIRSFSKTNIINNFLCEYSAIVSVSFPDQRIVETIFIILANFNTFLTLTIVLTSYVFIFVTILKIQSVSGRYKAFSTCASHLTGVTIFFGIILFLYCVPSSKTSWLLIRVSTVFYTVVVPMLNPLIYSLRNNDVKETITKLMDLAVGCHNGWGFGPGLSRH
ncbi:olfactory receptor 5D18-like [Dromiciops gliroides]|uniref:olfactory receptor 5D18-like n=1 Tax=Dromiciops gliroides TaxID=33562 RepID=UPI001CC65BA1|nr:olfactory receptor 5D18-like [Dromiciops gliroides]